VAPRANMSALSRWRTSPCSSSGARYLGQGTGGGRGRREEGGGSE
jgi:hypothetical protein